jgi:putative addiction module component (TIGR02574 family)
MMTAAAKAEILSLSIPERLQLVAEIWDSLADSPESVPLTEHQRVELDKRLAGFLVSPNSSTGLCS